VRIALWLRSVSWSAARGSRWIFTRVGAPWDDTQARYQALPLAAIEQIRIDRYTSYSSHPIHQRDLPGHGSHSGHVLWVEGDAHQIRFGAGRDERTLRWIRAYLEHRIASGSTRAGDRTPDRR